MARKKFAFYHDVLGNYATQLSKIASMDFLKATTEKALTESKEYVTAKLHQDMKNHHRTGRTESSIDDDLKVEWKGSQAQVKVGFKISEGGLASIFLMYGTPRREPTPMEADKKLYNDVYGTATQRKVNEIQQKVFEDAIRQVMEEK